MDDTRASHAIAAAALALLGLACAEVSAADAPASSPGFGAGIELHADEKVEEIGLPLFPGAVLRTKGDREPGGYRFGVRLGSFGWRIHVMTYHSDAAIEDVAAFYLHALAAFGKVVDCARPAVGRAGAAASAASAPGRPLACDASERPAHGRLVYKAGTRKDQRVVSLRRAAAGTDFQLVREEGTDED